MRKPTVDAAFAPTTLFNRAPMAHTAGMDGVVPRITVLALAGALWSLPAGAGQDDPRLDALFAALQADEPPADMERIERDIWIVWLESGDAGLDAVMAEGVRAMSGGDYATALASFNTLVDALPEFAEGWNKRATLYWLMGDFEASAADVDRTLALEPRHFGALSGLAMIRMAQQRHQEAYDALRRMLAVHPHAKGVRDRLERLRRILGVEA